MPNFSLESPLAPSLVILGRELGEHISFFEVQLIIFNTLKVVQSPDWNTSIFYRWRLPLIRTSLVTEVII